MLPILIRSLLPAFLLLFFLNGYSQIQFSTGGIQLGINAKGRISELVNDQTGRNYLSPDTSAPLVTLISNRIRYLPSAMKYKKSANTIILTFLPVAVTIELKITEKPTHLVLELVKAEPQNKVEAIVWGPIPITITDTVGEVIGVVRNAESSIGMLVLNIKTLGGDYPNTEGSTWARGLAAKSYPHYSSLQAYTINRNRERRVDAWGGEFKNMYVPSLKGETVVSSKIALFCCPERETLNRIEEITLSEKLPYPTINKTWFKKSSLFGKSYLISSFGEKEIDEMIGYTKRAGLISLYHEGPFKSWGHYILDSAAFPNGKEGIKNCVAKAHAAGLKFGVHTLTNFINTDDPYITPVPDDRLSMTGSSLLPLEVNALQKEIEVVSPEFFDQEKNNNLHTVKIGRELIRYKSISKQRPYKLLDCQRGAFGTTAASHARGEAVGKLMDHPYQVFFPNLELQREIARNLAGLFNETGIDHFDLDGFEGCLAAGEGDFGLELFAKDIYDNINHEFIMGTSLSKTFFWNICSYYNWGEPWYGGFKESMQQYRIENQGLFSRNYMPPMMGWYLLSEKTTLSEMEWMLARAAGYNAGFAMVARPAALRKNPLTSQLLDCIREWETARTSNVFSLEQQERLKDPKNEFHLENTGEGKWYLHKYAISPLFIHEKQYKQPGEPTSSSFTYLQQGKEQVMQFRINLNGKSGGIRAIRMQIDNYTEINLPISMSANESLVCDGTREIRLYSADGKPKGSYQMAAIPPILSPGSHLINFDAVFTGEEPPKIEVQFKAMGKGEIIGLNK